MLNFNATNFKVHFIKKLPISGLYHLKGFQAALASDSTMGGFVEATW